LRHRFVADNIVDQQFRGCIAGDGDEDTFMTTMRQSAGELPRRVVVFAAIVLSVPIVCFAVLRSSPALDLVFGSHAWHFTIVSAVAATALLLALAVARAARHLPDARTFFLAMGFLSMAGIFLAHGLGTAPFLGASHNHGGAVTPTTSGYGANSSAYDSGGYASDGYGAAESSTPVSAPGGYDSDGYGYGSGYDSPADHTGHEGIAGPSAVHSTRSNDLARLEVVGFSAELSLVASAIFFALAVAGLGRRITDKLTRHWSLWAFLVAGGIAGYMALALAAPSMLLWMPLTSGAVNWSVAELAWICFGFAGWRFFQAYRLSMLPLQGMMALAMAFLIEAQLFMIEGPTWHLSWWEYHVAMLAGFLGPVLGILWQYRQTGDLSVIVEGLFLREAVIGIRAGDPGALTALGVAVAAKDGETSAHVDRVSRTSVAIGERLDLPPDRLEVLRWAGRLHDLGKIGVPNSILLKPGRLTDGEFRVMQQHSVRGWQVAQRSGVLAQAAFAIRGHHERLNGSGYPDGLVGDQIPLEARIIAVADVWDALTANRSYRAALSPDRALAILRRDAGTLLDPQCVEALLDILERSGMMLVPTLPVLNAQHADPMYHVVI
jgi:HD-GYP domain-containing protein (c-di-GMP phosphodiesterase class II)